MKRSEIIEAVNQMTERKSERIGTLLPTFYRLVVQDICKRERFWWRRVEFSFSLSVGVSTYDMTTVSPTVPANAMTELLLDEITKFTVILSPNPFQVAEFVAVYDPETLIDMINNTQLTAPASGNTQSPGGRYTMDPSGINTIRIDPPDLAYTAHVVGWGMPNPATDSTNDNVPLIPAWAHNTIIAGMNAKVFRYAYGSKNEKTLDAVAEYEQGLQDLFARKQFDPNYRSMLSLSEDAVRST